MSCLSETMVAALAGGAASAMERRGAEEHLARCAECRRLVSELARLDPEEPYVHFERVTQAWDEAEVPPPRPIPRLRTRPFALVALVLVLAGIASLLAWRRPPARAPRPPRRLVVLDPRLATVGDSHAWMAVAIGELVRLELAEEGGPRVVNGDATARATIELARAAHAPDDPSRLRHRLDVDAIVSGSLSIDGDTVRLELRADTADAQAAAPRELVATAARAGQELRVRLGLEPLDDATVRRLCARLPAGDALRLWAEGLARHRVFDERGARDRLLQAAEAAPRNALVQAALMTVLDALGDGARAALAARQVLAYGAELSPAERTAIAARLHETAGDWQSAIAGWRQLDETFPDAAYAVRLANALQLSGRPREALALLRGRSHAGDAEAAVLALATARAALAAGDAAQARRAGETATRAATAVGAGALVAASYRVTSAALARLGHVDAALAAADAARAESARLGDDAARSDAMLAMGVLYARSSRFADARVWFEEARQLARASDDDTHLRLALESLAVLGDRGR